MIPYTIYLRDDDYAKTYELAKAFVKKFPEEMVAHFLLARAAFGVLKYEEAKPEARKAFNMSKKYDDMLAMELLASTAHLELKEYTAGYGLRWRSKVIARSSRLSCFLADAEECGARQPSGPALQAEREASPGDGDENAEGITT